GCVEGSVGKHLRRSSPVAHTQRGCLSQVINASSSGMCSTVACISHLARALVFELAAHKHTCNSAVLTTSAPKKYLMPARPITVGRRLTPSSAAAYRMI